MGNKYIIQEGKDLNQLIKVGLSKLNKKREEVSIEILQEGKTLMGISVKEYKVKITVSRTDENTIQDLEDLQLDKAFGSMEDIHSNNNSFDIKYLDDGVYLAAYENASSDEITAKRVLNRIERKKIENPNVGIVKEVIAERKGDFVKFAPFQTEKHEDADVIIDISNQDMKAYMTLLAPLGGKELNYEDALKKVKEKIKYGLFDEEVRNIVNNKIYNKRMLIAKGKEEIDGKDGYIEYNFETDRSSNKVTLLEDGSVDFRNLNLIHNVKEGDVLAVMVPPVKGENGSTVNGRILNSKEGKIVALKFGKNITLSEDGLKLISQSDGQVSLEGDKVNVNEIYLVPANVDNSTGNINFNGSVRIIGNVMTGFEVRADGDIEVNGVAEAAYIESGGKVILKRGMQGHNSGKLIAQGDIVTKYIENATLISQGNIKAEAIMHSNIICNGNIEVGGKKGLIVGGVCKARFEIHAKIIGSTMSTTTDIEVGLDPNLKLECEKIKNEIQDTENHIEKLNKSILLLDRLRKSSGLSPEKEQLLIKCLSDRNTLTKKINDLKQDLQELESEIDTLSKGRVKVKDIVYPGVKITIGNSVMFIKKEYKHCTFYEEDKDIKIGPFEM